MTIALTWSSEHCPVTSEKNKPKIDDVIRGIIFSAYDSVFLFGFQNQFMAFFLSICCAIFPFSYFVNELTDLREVLSPSKFGNVKFLTCTLTSR